MSATRSIRIDLATENLHRLTSVVEELGEEEMWPPDLLFQVQLVLDEIGDNLVEHLESSHKKVLEITLDSRDTGVTIDLMDEGPPFNPLSDAPEADLTSSLEERSIGGLGLHLVRTLMDEMTYRREHGKNHLILVKRREQ